MAKEKAITRITLKGAKKAIARSEDRTDWARLKAMSEEDIRRAIADDPDSSLLDSLPGFLGAILRGPLLTGLPEPKIAVHIRLDPDIIRWFKSKGPRYQSRINAALRWYMDVMRFDEATDEADRQSTRQAKKR
jgi:hypothetical protein